MASSNALPLAVVLPWKPGPYQDALPIWTVVPLGGDKISGDGSDVTLPDIVEHPCITVSATTNSGRLFIDSLPRAKVGLRCQRSTAVISTLPLVADTTRHEQSSCDPIGRFLITRSATWMPEE